MLGIETLGAPVRAAGFEVHGARAVAPRDPERRAQEPRSMATAAQAGFEIQFVDDAVAAVEFQAVAITQRGIAGGSAGDGQNQDAAETRPPHQPKQCPPRGQRPERDAVETAVFAAQAKQRGEVAPRRHADDRLAYR